MIKLIATDMDGTFLDSKKEFSPEFSSLFFEMQQKGLAFSETATAEVAQMYGKVMDMFAISKQTFESLKKNDLPRLTELENEVDGMKKTLIVGHFARLAEGNCRMELSPYYSSLVAGLERVADHLINVGYSVLNPTGSQSQAVKDEQVKL